jgi:hypothetical protein
MRRARAGESIAQLEDWLRKPGVFLMHKFLTYSQKY